MRVAMAPALPRAVMASSSIHAGLNEFWAIDDCDGGDDDVAALVARVFYS